MAAKNKRPTVVASGDWGVEEAAKYLGLSPAYLRQMRFYMKGPVSQQDKKSRRVSYRHSDLEAWNTERLAKKRQAEACRAAKKAATGKGRRVVRNVEKKLKRAA